MKNGYAAHSIWKPRSMLYMHRVIAGAPKGTIVDHVNGDTLYNVCWNLRVGTQSQNLGNMGLNRRSTTGYKGVSFIRVRDGVHYRAYININRKQRSLGMYKTAEEAALAYNRAATEQWGSHARHNIIMSRTA